MGLQRPFKLSLQFKQYLKATFNHFTSFYSSERTGSDQCVCRYLHECVRVRVCVSRLPELFIKVL